MRISTSQIYTNANRNMMENQSSLLDIQDKLASGKKFTSLAEDPVGASRVVSLNREISQLEMFQSNIDSSRRRLELEETTLQDFNTTMDRMRELVIQAGGGGMTDEDRSIIAYELEQLIDYAAGLMNTRDAKGEYLFSGSQGLKESYALTNGRYEFQGDATTRDIQISSALYIKSTDSGEFLFESIKDNPQLTALGGMGDIIQDQSVTDSDSFSALMQDTGDIRLEVSGSTAIGYTYSLKDSGGNLVLDDSGAPYAENQPYDPSLDTSINVLPGITFDVDLPEQGEPEFGAPDVRASGLTASESFTIDDADAYTRLMRQAGDSLSIQSVQASPGVYEYQIFAADGTPLPASQYSIDVAGNTLTLSDASGNQALTLERDAAASAASADVTLGFVPPASATLRFEQPPTNILNAMLDTVELLKTDAAGDETQKELLVEGLALSLDQVTAAQERISEATASIGSRLKTLDDAEFSNTDFKLMTEGTLSAVQDLDYAEAATELAKRQLALEAAYASFSKIQGLSLFNYIN